MHHSSDFFRSVNIHERSKISLGVVVALSVEWSPPIPEIRSSNPIIGKFIKSLLIFNLQLKIILNLALDCEEDKNT